MTGTLAEFNISRYDRFENSIFEMILHLCDNLSREVVTRVEHSKDDSQLIEILVQSFSDQFCRVKKLS